MDDDIIRILVATDNHLGYLGKDTVRSNDSFAAFEEVLITARKEKADFVLLAGDLFHENKPSRKTIHASIDILRKYCTGSDDVYIEILNNQEDIFKNRERKVNYENPFESICLPIFAIHGNHDDPSRDGISEPLSALDILSVSNLINYFGKSDQVDDIEITPILLQKANTRIALYGLGAVRDERLNRMWANKKVKFVKPTAEQGSFLNIFVLHQNRDYGRGQKNCIHESMIPDWMDIVIWGNEHECIPSFVESLVGTFRIYQPGSSVATSLSQGESNDNPKHMGLIEIRSDFKFRLEAIPFKNIRPFLYSDISLSSVGELDMHDSKIEEKITDILSNRVKKMIREARSLLVSNGERDISKSNTNSPAQMYQLTDPMKVIIRLKVENSGYPTISLHRFGSQFIQEVANPSEMLLFYKQKRMNAFAHDGKQNRNDDPENIEDYEDGDAILSDSSKRIRIEDLVKQHLASGAGGSKQLNLMNAEDLSLALEEFVLKKVPTAITDVVEKRLEETQLALNQDKNIHLNDLHQHVSEINSSHTTSSSTSRAIAPAVTTTVPGRASKKKKVAVSDDEDDMAVSLPKPKASKKTSVAPAASSTKRQTRGKVTKYVEEIEDDEEENDESVASSDDNMEVDGDDNDESEAISNTSASEDEQKGSKRGKSKGSVAPSKTARGKAAPPAAKSSAKAVKKTTTASTVASKFDPTTFISSNNKVFEISDDDSDLGNAKRNGKSTNTTQYSSKPSNEALFQGTEASNSNFEDNSPNKKARKPILKSLLQRK